MNVFNCTPQLIRSGLILALHLKCSIIVYLFFKTDMFPKFQGCFVRIQYKNPDFVMRYAVFL
jgi:hypothetical protein